MESAHAADVVLADLGDKVVARLGQAVFAARTDLTEYRDIRPLWVAESSERGLANWIHDRLWIHLVRLMEDVPECSFVDVEPVRAMYVGTRFHFRAKRHGEDGRVTTYPTQAALDFMIQDPPTLAGLEEVRLIVGYIWMAEAREIGPAVLSLRDGLDRIIWEERLAESGMTGRATGLTPILPVGPQLPTVDQHSDSRNEQSP